MAVEDHLVAAAPAVAISIHQVNMAQVAAPRVVAIVAVVATTIRKVTINILLVVEDTPAMARIVTPAQGVDPRGHLPQTLIRTMAAVAPPLEVAAADKTITLKGTINIAQAEVAHHATLTVTTALAAADVASMSRTTWRIPMTMMTTMRAAGAALAAQMRTTVAVVARVAMTKATMAVAVACVATIRTTAPAAAATTSMTRTTTMTKKAMMMTSTVSLMTMTQTMTVVAAVADSL